MIEVYNVFTPHACNTLINQFNNDDRRRPGTSGANIRNDQWKKSTDLGLNLYHDEIYNDIIHTVGNTTLNWSCLLVTLKALLMCSLMTSRGLSRPSYNSSRGISASSNYIVTHHWHLPLTVEGEPTPTRWQSTTLRVASTIKAHKVLSSSTAYYD